MFKSQNLDSRSKSERSLTPGTNADESQYITNALITQSVSKQCGYVPLRVRARCDFLVKFERKRRTHLVVGAAVLEFGHDLGIAQDVTQS